MFYATYMIINFTYTKVTGDPPYKLWKWDSLKAYLLALVMLPICAIMFCLIYGLTRLKYKLLNEKTEKEEEKVEKKE